MKYYGSSTNSQELVSLWKTQQVADTKISEALSDSGSIKTELDKKIDNPSIKSNRQILEYNGTTWVAADKPTSGVWGQITGTLSNQTDLQTALNGKETADATIIKQANVVDNVTSTTTTAPLSANQGKALNDRINNLESIGRFLSIWNCTTGLPITEPGTKPYSYKTGDYFRIGTTGTTNYKPDGTSYTGTASTVVETLEVATNDVYFFDGTTWTLQVNHVGAFVSDVQVDGTSVVSSGVANITGKENASNKVTSISSSSTDAQYPSAKLVYDQLANKIANPASKSSGQILEYNGTDWVAGNQVGFQAGTTAPSNTKLIWIDTTNTIPVIKYYNGSQWKAANVAVWG